MRNIKDALTKWNRLVFGNVQNRIKELKLVIQHLQTHKQTRAVVDRDVILQEQLHEVLRREEAMWKDKEKARWYEEGDFNMRYFHLPTIIDRSNNAINRIQSLDNLCITGREEIGSEFVNFFTALFTTSQPQFPADLQNLFLPVVSI